MASLDIARDLLARGFQPVLIRGRTKKPELSEWQKQRYTLDDLSGVFKNGANVGILLGAPSDHTVDIDLDHPLATRILKAMGEPSTLAYSHAERNHYLFRASPPVPATVKFQGTRQGSSLMFVEVRSNGGQSLAPGSIHPDDGIAYEWLNDLPRAEWTGQQLIELGREVATSCLLADHWRRPAPNAHGSRHHLALAAAGFLALRSVDAERIEDIIRAAAQVRDDEELEDRVVAVRDTIRKVQQGANVYGLPTLAQYIGDEDAANLVRWWPDTTPQLRIGGSTLDRIQLLRPRLNGAGGEADEETGELAPEFVVYAGDEFLALDMPVVSWIVPDHIADGAIVVFYGATATFKTYAATDLALSVATGGDWCGCFPTAPGKVLIIQEDTPKALYQQTYLRPMVARRNVDPADLHDTLFVAAENGFLLDVATRLHQLEMWLALYRPRLVVLDSFYLLHQGDIKDEVALVAVLRIIRTLREQFHCTFVVIDHSRKSGQSKSEGDPIDDLYGGQAKGATSDGMIQFLRVKGEKSCTYMAVRKVRGAPLPDPVRLRLTDGLLQMEGKESETTDGSARAVHQWLLNEGGTRTYKQISNGINLSVKTVMGACHHLEDKRLVWRGKSGNELTFMALDRPNSEEEAEDGWPR